MLTVHLFRLASSLNDSSMSFRTGRSDQHTYARYLMFGSHIELMCNKYEGHRIMTVSDSPPVCPQDSNHGAMKLKTAGKGPHAGNNFWGCSKYPTCKKIVNIPGRGKTSTILPGYLCLMPLKPLFKLMGNPILYQVLMFVGSQAYFFTILGKEKYSGGFLG